jgi:hypothetical protein
MSTFLFGKSFSDRISPGFNNFISTMNKDMMNKDLIKDIKSTDVKPITIVKPAVDAVKTVNSLMNDPLEKKMETLEYMGKEYGGKALDYMTKHKGEIASKALDMAVASNPMLKTGISLGKQGINMAKQRLTSVF